MILLDPNPARSSREEASAGDAPGPLALRRRFRRWRGKAAHGDLEARDALLAGHWRRLAAADRIDEGDELGAQRLRIADREVPHRIAAVGLEAETFGDLQRQQVGDQIFVAGGDV